MLIYKQKENEANVENKVKHIEARVKWYKPEKGYGFLIREDKAQDIMIHFSTLDKVGCAYISPGDRIICDVAFGKSGAQVIEVIQIMFMSPDSANIQEIKGIIKWYKPDKGYGFIQSDEGKDIFFPGDVLCTAGCKNLQPGLRVLAKVFQSKQGPVAQMIKVIYEE
jgi:cold shock protein